MRAFACLLVLAACGGDGSVEGEPLIQSSLMGEFNNKPWTPAYGFGRTNKAGTTFELFVGAEKISCADDFKGTPRNGHYGATGVPAPLAMGTFPTSTFQLIEVVGGKLDAQILIGSVQITSETETEVSAVLGLATTIENGSYSLTGAVTMLRCP